MSKPKQQIGPVVLCILDGWGKRAESQANAIALAETPNWDRMIDQWPTGELLCSGPDVGLPDGQMGNSEVGHMNIGAGRVVWQDLLRISNAIADGTMAQAAVLTNFCHQLKQSDGTCHIIGLISDGGVHAHQDHVVALARAVSGIGIPVRIHAFTDGRDTAPDSAIAQVKKFESDIAELEDTKIATVCGRYFSMDRDHRWDRVEKAYNLLTEGTGQQAQDACSAIEASHTAGITDEFIEPVSIGGYAQHGMRDGDGLISANFRADRMRELLSALLDPMFQGFARTKTINFSEKLGMVSYSDEIDRFLPALFGPQSIHATLGETIANAGLRQLRMAETEKYPHVTFFFNGGRETPFEREDRILVPSPKVATYDLQPEMSAPELTTHLVDAIRNKTADFIVVNYANGDMVGHTGSLKAAIAAVECVDACIGQVEKAILESDGTMLVTADHGNCEMMVDPQTGGPHTAHTLNPVPTVLVNSSNTNAKLANGRLADIAPTILQLLDIPQPNEMTGTPLIL